MIIDVKRPSVAVPTKESKRKKGKQENNNFSQVDFYGSKKGNGTLIPGATGQGFLGRNATAYGRKVTINDVSVPDASTPTKGASAI